MICHRNIFFVGNIKLAAGTWLLGGGGVELQRIHIIEGRREKLK